MGNSTPGTVSGWPPPSASNRHQVSQPFHRCRFALLISTSAGCIVAATSWDDPIFELDAAGIRATGREAETGFIVLTDYTARKEAIAAFPQGIGPFAISSSVTPSLSITLSSPPIASQLMSVFPSQGAPAPVSYGVKANGPTGVEAARHRTDLRKLAECTSESDVFVQRVYIISAGYPTHVDVVWACSLSPLRLETDGRVSRYYSASGYPERVGPKSRAY